MVLYTIKGAFTIKETDLYGPIKEMFESFGHTVKGEVKGCDIAILADDELWIVEMKKNFTIKLLYQAMSRLSISSVVFVAIPRPKRMDGDFRQMKKILKKLELGLITVALDSISPFAEIILLPCSADSKTKSAGNNPPANKKAAAMLKEIKGRTLDTPGGSTGTPITSAYKERCIKIACILKRYEILSPAELTSQYDCEKDAGAILQRNHYGWFERISRGKYSLSTLGLMFLEKNSDNFLVREYEKLFY